MNALNSAWTGDASDYASDRLDALFRAHYGRLARVVGRIVHDQAEAEEIAVDVFVKWRGHPAAQGDGAEGWLYRTAVRAALDRWRRARVERRQVRTVLAALRRRQATILLLWAEDLSYAGIAAAAGIQPSSVGSLLRRSQDAFKKEYEARYGHAS